MAVPTTDAPVYTDISGLSRLKRAAGNNDPAAIRTVAQQFESMFTRMMLKSMRDAVGPDPMFGSDQQQMYQGMADDQLAIQLSKGKGFGLADMLIRQLQRLGVKGADAAAAGTASVPGGTGAASEAGTASAAGSKAAAAYSATQRSTATTSSTTGSTPPDATRTTFVRDLWPQAQRAGLLLGVDPRNLIAQAALETHWGRNLPQDSAGRCSNNLFGLKASADWSGATAAGATQEFQGGIATGTTAQFRAYPSQAQSFDDYVALLLNNPRYSAALNTGGDVQAFAAALQRGGYATDPDYAGKLAAVAGTVTHEVQGLASSPGASTSVKDLKLAGLPPLTRIRRPGGVLSDE